MNIIKVVIQKHFQMQNINVFYFVDLVYIDIKSRWPGP